MFCLLASVPAIAQIRDVSGVIVDAQSGDPVLYARVSLCDRPHGTNANALGFFLLPGLPPGKTCLSVRAVGYRDTSFVVPPASSATTSIRVALQPVPIEMSVVKVTGAASAPLTQLRPSVVVIDQREIRSMPPAVQVDVFRSLAGLPGIVSTSDVSTQFYARGGAGDQNAIMLDGMRVYSPYHALGLFSIFDADIIRDATVYTGAFPAGYGGRLSSVVELTPRGGMSTTPLVSVTVSPLSAKLGAEGPIGRDWRVVASSRKSISTAPLRPFLHRSAPLEFYDLFARVTHNAENSTSSVAAMVFLSGDRLRPTSPDVADYAWRNSLIGIHFNGLLADRLYVSSKVYSSQFVGSREPAASLLTPTSSSVSDLTFHTDATAYTEGGGEYFFGFEFSFPSFDYRLVNTLGRSLIVSKILANASLWSRTILTTGLWAWDIGLHVDARALLAGSSGSAVQPRLAVSYTVDDRWKAKLAYGRYTQHEVTVNNEDDILSLFDAWIPVPDDMEPEYAEHLVAGLSGPAASNLGVDLQAYLKSYGSLVTYNPEKLVASDPDFTHATGRSYGVEAISKYSAGVTDVSCSYALAWTTLSLVGETYAPRYDRRHSLKALAVVEVLDQVDATVRWEFGSGLPFTPSLAYYNRLTYEDVFREPRVIQPGEPYIALGVKNSSRLPDYHRLDVGVSWQFGLGPLECSLSGSVVNVYNRRNLFYVDRQSGRRVNSLGIVPTAYVSVTYR